MNLNKSQQVSTNFQQGKRRAVFLDRDGVINELIYYEEHGIVDSPFKPEQMRVFPWIPEAIRRIKELGYKVVIVSNQPGIAKGYFSKETFQEIRERMFLQINGAEFDGEYYCFHHPEAKIKSFLANCECRKPKPGLILKAAEGMDINLSNSWMIGDGLTDIKAGKEAGCKTILLGRLKCELCHLMDEEDARPDFIVPNLLEAAQIISSRQF